jgi:membrane protease YdiL (CAAX protease family)
LPGQRGRGNALSAPAVSAQTAGLGRAFTRADGRDRIGVPFWNGLLSAFGAMAITLAAGFLATMALIYGIVLATGRMPSLNPTHPLVLCGDLASYTAAGWFAQWRLRAAGRVAFRRLHGADVRAILIAAATLILIRIGMAFELIATHQTAHVQRGFEHFAIVGDAPAVTIISISLGVFVFIALAPVVEEMMFRGLLFGALAPRIGVLGAALVSAVLFGAAHGDAVLFPFIAALGFVCAVAYAATGNLWVPITLHALSNVVGAAFLITSSTPS